MSEKELSIEKKRMVHSLVFPTFFLLVIWMVKLVEFVLDLDLAGYGIWPKNIKALTGILTSPLIHSDINHLINNSLPVFVLGVCVFYFYNKVAYKVFFIIYLVTGFWVWVFAREAFHIGASGIVYGLASFVLFSGIIRNNKRLLAISLLVVFLYGSMVWGIFPMDPMVSWESHLAGGVIGLILAVYFRDDLYIVPEPELPPDWDMDDNEEDDTSASVKNIHFTYFYKENDKNGESKKNNPD